MNFLLNLYYFNIVLNTVDFRNINSNQYSLPTVQSYDSFEEFDKKFSGVDFRDRCYKWRRDGGGKVG